MSEWIPVSERLPEKKGWYIVTKECGKYHFIDDAYFDGDNWLEQRLEWHKLVYAYDIIAWMPRPQPYEEEKALEQGDVLDKIKAEIKEWYWKADKQTLAKDPCVVDAMVDLFIRTIDKYKAESEG